MAVVFVALATTLQATQPVWWTASGGPLNGNSPNDSMVANQGQLKQFTQKAVLYLDTNLAGGAGTNLDNLLVGWSNYYATNGYNAITRAPQDFKGVNQGQLKNIGNLIWSQLVAAGYSGPPLWLTPNTNSEYEVVNIGQLKTVFDFDIVGDSDTNGLPDWWELRYFGHLGNATNSLAPAGNGKTILWDYQHRNNPNDYYQSRRLEHRADVDDVERQ